MKGGGGGGDGRILGGGGGYFRLSHFTSDGYTHARPHPSPTIWS